MYLHCVLYAVMAIAAQQIVIITGLKSVSSVAFTFPGQDQQPPAPPLPPAGETNQVLARQLISGTVPTAAGGTIGGTCICVPVGQCPAGPIDGSGQIDVRIVNNPGSTSTPPVTCAAGLVICCQNRVVQCGIRYALQGTIAPTAGQAAFGAYPWQAAILTSADVYLGSGALISARHVLTAAHKIATLAISSYKVRLGEWDAASTSEPIRAQEFTVSAVTIHPNYNSNNLQNSIAILTLSTPVQLGQTPTINTACLAAASFVGQRCYVSGWGKNDFGPNGQYQAIQKQVDVLIRSQAECQSTLAGTRLGSNFIFNSAAFICAGGEAGKDACTGDGGSPLVCETGSRWYLVGLVAWGIGCASAGVPGVYVNVVSYIPWIQTIIGT